MADPTPTPEDLRILLDRALRIADASTQELLRVQERRGYVNQCRTLRRRLMDLVSMRTELRLTRVKL